MKRRHKVLIFHGKVEVCAVSDLAHGHVVASGCVGATHALLCHLLLLVKQTLSLKIRVGYVRIRILFLVYMRWESLM